MGASRAAALVGLLLLYVGSNASGQSALPAVPSAGAQPPVTVHSSPVGATATGPASGPTAPSPLRRHPFNVDGEWFSAQQALVHSWDTTTSYMTEGWKKVTYRVCNSRSAGDELYFQWLLAGFGSGPRALIAPSVCHELDRSGKGVLVTVPDAPIYFNVIPVLVRHSTITIDSSTSKAERLFAAALTVITPRSMVELSPGTRRERLSMSTMRNENEELVRNSIKVLSPLALYIALPRLSEPQLRSLRTQLSSRPGMELVSVDAAIADFNGVEAEAARTALSGREVLRLIPLHGGSDGWDYTLPIQDIERKRLPILVRDLTTKVLLLQVGYDTPGQ